MRRLAAILFASVISVVAAGVAAANPAMTPAAGAYLIVPYAGLGEAEKKAFLEGWLPMFAMEGAVINAGTLDAPWYCVALPDREVADFLKAQVEQSVPALGTALMVELDCAAG